MIQGRFSLVAGALFVLALTACGQSTAPLAPRSADTVIRPIATPTPSCGSSAVGALQSEDAIREGPPIDFVAGVAVTGLNPSAPTHLFMSSSAIKLTANGVSYTIAAPNTLITFDPAAEHFSLHFDKDDNEWIEVVPPQLAGNAFLSEAEWRAPDGLTNTIPDVVWSGTFQTDTPGVTLIWRWSATQEDDVIGDSARILDTPCDTLQPPTGDRH